MYIERKANMDHEVNEATAALKGLLGISSGANNPTIKKFEGKETKAKGTNAEEGQEITSPEQNKSAKKKRNKKNKKKLEEPEKNSPKPPKPQSQVEKSAPKDKNNSSTKKKGSKSKNKKLENFAWSAFQSSPDASKLPIPVFSSPVQSRKVLSLDRSTSQPNQTTGEPVTEDREVTPISPNTLQPVTPSVKDLTDTNSSTAVNVEESTPTKQEASATGVNLAILASNPPPSTPNDAKYSTNDLESPQAQLFNSADAYSNLGSPHLHAYTSPHHMHPYQYLPPPPPGHVTIQVQVPPVLMPGRHMVVTSPAGYPVQIAVPEGCHAGMIIPVFVPAAPPMHHHMMPPQPPNHPHMPYNTSNRTGGNDGSGYYNTNIG